MGITVIDSDSYQKDFEELNGVVAALTKKAFDIGFANAIKTIIEAIEGMKRRGKTSFDADEMIGILNRQSLRLTK